MVKTIIFGLVSWNNYYARCKSYTLVNCQKKLFVKLGNFSTLYSSLKCIYIKHRYCVFSEVAKTSKWSCPTSKILIIFKNFAFALQHTFRSLRGNNNRWDTPIWIWMSRIADFCTRKKTITPARYLSCFKVELWKQNFCRKIVKESSWNYE